MAKTKDYDQSAESFEKLKDKFPGMEWHTKSQHHAYVSRHESDNTKAKAALAALKLIRGMDPQPKMLVTGQEFMVIMAGDFRSGYTQNEPTETKNHANPSTGNYYTPVAMVDDVLILIRGWNDHHGSFTASSKESHYSFRVRAVCKPGLSSPETLAKIEAEVEQVIAKMEKRLSERTEVTVQDGTVVATQVELPPELEELFDFTPTEGAKKREKVRLPDDFEW